MSEPIYIRQAQTENVLGEKIYLYYFTKESRKPTAEGEEISYCVGIDMYTQLCGERTVKESKIIEDAFCEQTEAQRFIDMLCRGCVTPATLQDIVSDYAM